MLTREQKISVRSKIVLEINDLDFGRGVVEGYQHIQGIRSKDLLPVTEPCSENFFFRRCVELNRRSILGYVSDKFTFRSKSHKMSREEGTWCQAGTKRWGKSEEFAVPARSWRSFARRSRACRSPWSSGSLDNCRKTWCLILKCRRSARCSGGPCPERTSRRARSGDLRFSLKSSRFRKFGSWTGWWTFWSPPSKKTSLRFFENLRKANRVFLPPDQKTFLRKWAWCLKIWKIESAKSRTKKLKRAIFIMIVFRGIWAIMIAK